MLLQQHEPPAPLYDARMPVVVTGASGSIGRAAVRAFADRSPEVRAYVRRRDAADPLRALGAKVAIGEIDDLDTLSAVVKGAHTICHLVGGLDVADEEVERVNLRSVECVLEAARDAKAARLLFVSAPGADAGSTNAFLRAKGAAEAAIGTSGIDHVILRCTHAYGPGSRWLERTRWLAGGWPAVVLGSGRQLLAPVPVDDVAAVLAAADDRAQAATGTWGLEGPDRVTADGLVDLVAGRRRRTLHVSGRTAQRFAERAIGTPLTLTALEILELDSLADAPDAAKEFGVERTPLREGLERAMRPVLER
jgi:uncharacterized protein YbjT (DUF2867 family)